VGKVAAVAADGKTITLEVPAAVRGEEPMKVVVKLGGQAAVSYFNVGPDKAKIAEGMQARVWLEGGSKDTAARVVLMGTVPERWATVTGKVVGVSKDGATITLEQPPVARGEGPTRVAIKLAETRVAYTGVGPGEAKPTEGYFAQVRLVDGSKDTAAQVLFMKGGGDGRR
jgi:hypothetical protein